MSGSNAQNALAQRLKLKLRTIRARIADECQA